MGPPTVNQWCQLWGLRVELVDLSCLESDQFPVGRACGLVDLSCLESYQLPVGPPTVTEVGSLRVELVDLSCLESYQFPAGPPTVTQWCAVLG